tara:strand:+ start:187 stop:675 length:489 start_codon:yes stop_codon:yes gene_type:complete
METGDNQQFEDILKEVNAEVGTDSTSDNKGESEISFPHEKIMSEEDLTKDDLPTDVRKMVITFERKLRMAKAKNASEATMLKIQNLSTLIGDKIIDHLESDIPIKEDGGGIGGMDDMGGGADDIDDGGLDDLGDGDSMIDDDIEIKEKGGMFQGILGGILDW